MKRIALTSLLLLSSPAFAKNYILSAPSSNFSLLAEGSDITVADINPEQARELSEQGWDVEEETFSHLMGAVTKTQVLNQQQGWASSAMKVPAAHALPESKGQGVRVCVLDSGVDQNHSLLRGKVADAVSLVPNEGTEDVAGHGTHVASLVAGATELGSTATQATVISVKVMAKNGTGSNAWVAQGVQACVRKNANVINMSLGSPSASNVLKKAIDQALKAGVTVVAAAGNDGRRLNYPAAFPGVLAVGAMTKTRALAAFSSRGEGMGILAPGVGVLGAKTGGGLIEMSGTSMAAPLVSGVVAMKISRGSRGLKAQHLGLKPNEQGIGLVDALLTANNR